MLKQIAHVGITVSDMEQSIAFYRDVLGLKLVDRMVMEGDSTDRLFGEENMRAELAYLNGGDGMHCPPVELICFTENPAEAYTMNLHATCISEICFQVNSLDEEYRRLKRLGVTFLSKPQNFELGGNRSKAVYFRDPDGNILELMEIYESL